MTCLLIRIQCRLHGIPAKSAWFESDHEETSEKPKLRSILQKKMPSAFQQCQEKQKKGQKNCSRLKEMKEKDKQPDKKDMTRHFTKHIWISNNYMTRCSISLLIREMKVKTTIYTPLHPPEWLKFKRPTILSVDKDVK